MYSKSTDKTGSEIVGSFIAAAGLDLLAAWVLMRGLNGLHIAAGYGACLLICVAAHIVIGNSAR